MKDEITGFHQGQIILAFLNYVHHGLEKEFLIYQQHRYYDGMAE
jgi:hypothetical protein